MSKHVLRTVRTLACCIAAVMVARSCSDAASRMAIARVHDAQARIAACSNLRGAL